MFDTGETLREDIGYHIVRSDESEVYCAVGNALPDKMISYINMFRCCVVDGVSGQEIGSTVVDMEGGGESSALA